MRKLEQADTDAVKLDSRIAGIINLHTRENAECFVRDAADAINDQIGKGASSEGMATWLIKHMGHPETAWIEAELALRIGLDDVDMTAVEARLNSLGPAPSTGAKAAEYHSNALTKKIAEHGGLPPSMWHPGG